MSLRILPSIVLSCIISSSLNFRQPLIPTGIPTALSLSFFPLSVNVTINVLSSIFERSLVTYPLASSFFNTGVRVPESRKSLSPSSLTFSSYSSHITIITMYCVHVRSNLSKYVLYLLTISFEQAYSGKQS